MTALTTNTLALAQTWVIADGPSQDDPTKPHGQVRGIYDAVARPGSS